MNPYDVLEIPQGASADEIKAAYHQMAKLWHPDRYSGDAKVEAEHRFRMLAEAYNMLKDVPRQPTGANPAPAAPPQPGTPLPPLQIQLTADADRPSPNPQNKTPDDWFNEARASLDSKEYERGLGLIQYAIRLDGERAEFHALYAKLLDVTNGDKRMMVRALELAIQMNPKDADSTILLAQTFQGLGMHARASRLWNVARNLAPNHAVFGREPKKAEGKAGSGKGKASDEAPGLGEQFAVLVAEIREAINRLFKRG